MDETKLELARAEAKQLGISNVEFRAADIRAGSGVPVVDVVYSRFLLTHLSDPAGAVAAFRSCLRPGGMIGVEDVLLRQSGFVDIHVAVVQPVALHGEVKLLNPLTMENIAGAEA